MRHSSLLAAPVLALSLLSACVAHDKAGEKYAAVGDWKNAYAEFRQAVADKPQDPVLRQKYEEARARALDGAVAQANACGAQNRWDCALAEADFALSVDPTRSDMAAVRRRAAAEVALARLDRVQGEVVAGRLQSAAQLIQQARQLSDDPAVVSAARGAAQAYASGVVAESDRLRAQRKYADAVALLKAGVDVEPGLRPRLDAAAREYEGWKTAEHDRFVAEGEGHLSAGRWADAAKSFQSAQQLRPDDRARALGEYARHMQAGDEAAARTDWNGAAQAYRAAAALRVDRGQAQELAARVQVKPYAVTVRTVLVTPLRPNGMPWVGDRDRRLDRAQSALAAGWREPLAGPVLLALNDVPPAARPDLVVEVTLPGGQQLVTSPERAVYSTPRAVFVVAANGFDKRKVVFRVYHRLPAGGTEDIGYAEASLADLVAHRGLLLQDRSIGALELAVDAAEGSREGTFTGLTPVAAPAAPPASPAAPPPVRASPPAPRR